MSKTEKQKSKLNKTESRKMLDKLCNNCNMSYYIINDRCSVCGIKREYDKGKYESTRI